MRYVSACVLSLAVTCWRQCHRIHGVQGGQALCFIQVFHILCWLLLKIIQGLHYLKKGWSRAVWGMIELGGTGWGGRRGWWIGTGAGLQHAPVSLQHGLMARRMVALWLTWMWYTNSMPKWWGAQPLLPSFNKSWANGKGGDAVVGSSVNQWRKQPKLTEREGAAL